MKKLLVLLVALPFLFQCSDNDRIINLPEDAEPYYAFTMKLPFDYDGFNFIGGQTEIPVYLDSIGDRPLTNFSLSIAFEDTMLTVLDVIPGPALECWEVFNYSVSNFTDENGVPMELLNIFAIANIKHIWGYPDNCPNNEGAILNHPEKLFDISLQITSDSHYECWCLPLNFYWRDCNDNTVNDADYDVQYVSREVYEIDWLGIDRYQNLIPEDNEINENDHIYGTFDHCLMNTDNTLTQKSAVIDFYNSCCDIAGYGPINSSGDLNLNNVAHEIADALLYVDYFLYGKIVFYINLQGQIENSDVNQDGVSLTMADLVYLIRVLTGDAVAFNQLQHNQDTAYLSLENDTVFIECKKDLGAVYLSLFDRVDFTPLLNNFEIKGDYINGYTKAVVYALNRQTIPAGKVPLLIISDFTYIQKFETAGYSGEIVTALIRR